MPDDRTANVEEGPRARLVGVAFKWEEECKLRRHLAHAAGMMKNPELTEAWRVWKGLYTAVRESLRGVRRGEER